VQLGQMSAGMEPQHPEALAAEAEEQIRRSAITPVPGSGFDVLPTDCVAGYVAAKSERPASLLITVRGLEGASQGTLRIAIRLFRNGMA
jgi:short subunit dehydrogenase-like uncharacterized protein